MLTIVAMREGRVLAIGTTKPDYHVSKARWSMINIPVKSIQDADLIFDSDGNVIKSRSLDFARLS